MIKLLNIADKQIEVLIKGSGKRTVLILTGISCSMYDWLEIVDQVSIDSRVIVYHRPGYGKSELGNLHILDELELPVSDERYSDQVWLKKIQKYSVMKSNDLKRELNPMLALEQSEFPENIKNDIVEFETNPNLYKAVLSEFSNWHNDAQEIKSMGDFPNIPLKVLARDPIYSVKLQLDEGIPYEEAKLLEDTWQQLIQEQATLSSNSEIHLVENAGHSINLDRPNFVINTIKDMMRNM